MAHKTGALATRDLDRVVVDTTVQPKAVAHPTRGCAIARWRSWSSWPNATMCRCARATGALATRAAIMVGHYTHAHRFKRARRALKFLRTRLGRVIRDIRRKIAGNPRLTERFADLLALAVRVRVQDHRQRGPKVYALHAPEVECIGKDKARTPYEFGCEEIEALAAFVSPLPTPQNNQTQVDKRGVRFTTRWYKVHSRPPSTKSCFTCAPSSKRL